MKRAGDILREERLRQNLSLEEISVRTRVRADFLEHIESGNYDRLPSQVYIRGFISSYANALGLDSDRVLPFYRRERKQVEDPGTDKLPQPIENRKFRITPSKLLMLFISIALTAFLVILFIQYRNYAGAPVLIIDSPQNNSTTSAASVEVSGKTDTDTEVTVNGEKVNQKVDGTFQLTFSLNEGVNRIRIIATSKLGKKSIIERVVERTNENQPQP